MSLRMATSGQGETATRGGNYSKDNTSSGKSMNYEAAGAAGSGFFGFVSTLMTGESMKQASDYNAKVAIQNAAISRQQGIEEARRTRVIGRKVLGEARAAYGASGIGLSGSALDVLAESASKNELDALTIEHESEARARMFEADAAMQRHQGKIAKRNSYLKAASQFGETGAKIAGASGGG